MINNISSSSQIITTTTPIPSLEDCHLFRAALDLIDNGQTVEAGEKACSLEDATMKTMAVQKVAVAFLKLNNTEKAVEFALLIPNSHFKNETLVIITSDLINRNNRIEASKTLQLIHPTPEFLADKLSALSLKEDLHLRKIVEDLINNGQIEEAGEKACLLEDTTLKEHAFQKVAVAFQEQLNNTEKAVEFALLLVADNYHKNEILGTITSDLIKRNNRKEALKTLQLIHPTPGSLAAKLSELCASQGDFDTACTSAKLILDEDLKHQSLYSIADQLIKLNKFDECLEFAEANDFLILDTQEIENAKKAYLDAINDSH